MVSFTAPPAISLLRLADFFSCANFFIASSRFWSNTCAYLGTICVDECPNIFAIVSGDTPALVNREANA